MELLTRKSLEKLQSLTCHVLVAEDFDDIRKLDELAKKVTDPLSEENQQFLSIVRIVNGQRYHPLTLGRALFADAHFADMAEDEYTLALVWILTIEVADYETSTHSEINTAINKWSMSAKLTRQQFEKIIHDTYVFDSDGESASYGTVIGLLCKEYGATPDYWLSADHGTVKALLDDFRRRSDEELKKAKKDAAKSKTAIGGFTLSARADHKYRMFEKELADKWTVVSDGE